MEKIIKMINIEHIRGGRGSRSIYLGFEKSITDAWVRGTTEELNQLSLHTLLPVSNEILPKLSLRIQREVWVY